MKRQLYIWASVLFCNEFVRAALYYVWLPLVQSYRHDMSISWVGICTSCQFAADAATKLLYGVAASRGHSRLILRGGAALSCSSVLGLLFTHSPAFILVFSVAFGCGAASVWPAALSHFSRNSESGCGESMAQVFVPWMAGTGMGMFLTNILLHHRANVYLGLGTATGIVLIGVWFLHPAPQEGAESLRREWQLVRILSRKMKPFLPPMIVQTLVIGTLSPFFALFAVRSLHLHPSQYALFLGGIGSITVLLLWPLGKVSDRMGRLSLLSIAYLISAVSILALATCHTWGQAMVPAALFAASFGAVFPAWNAHFLESVPHWLHTRAVGVFTAVEDSGTIFGPFIGALSWQFVGPSGPFVLAALLMGALALYFLLWWRISTKLKPTNM